MNRVIALKPKVTADGFIGQKLTIVKAMRTIRAVAPRTVPLETVIERARPQLRRQLDKSSKATVESCVKAHVRDLRKQRLLVEKRVA